jgi:hypothetical protein
MLMGTQISKQTGGNFQIVVVRATPYIGELIEFEDFDKEVM